jgi:3-carboxy-cis,cis-muconate cycloisomerase
LADWLSLVSGSLAKMAQDIILMPQKPKSVKWVNLPMVSELIIAAARTNAFLLSAMHR